MEIHKKPTVKLIPLPAKKKEVLSKYLAVALQSEIKVLDLNQVLFFKAASNYTEIYQTENRRIITSLTLKRYANRLCPKRFLRVHNSFIVNTSSIVSYLPDIRKIMLLNKQEIPVSISRREALISYLKSLMV